MKAIIDARQLSKEFGVPRSAIPALIAKGVLPQPIRLADGETAKRRWLRSAVAQALGVPLTPPN